MAVTGSSSTRRGAPTSRSPPQPASISPPTSSLTHPVALMSRSSRSLQGTTPTTTIVSIAAPPVIFGPATSFHAAANAIIKGSGAPDILFQPALSGHAAQNFITRAAGGADIPFQAAASGHHGIDFLVRGRGGADILFQAALSGHLAQPLIVEGSGSADILFQPAASGHTATNFITQRVGWSRCPVPRRTVRSPRNRLHPAGQRVTGHRVSTRCQPSRRHRL